MRIATARFEMLQGWMSALSYRQSRVSFWIARHPQSSASANAAFNSSRGALPEIPAQLFWRSYFF
jgi:hypothetical protein